MDPKGYTLIVPYFFKIASRVPRSCTSTPSTWELGDLGHKRGTGGATRSSPANRGGSVGPRLAVEGGRGGAARRRAAGEED
jgi:hypothetical protein